MNLIQIQNKRSLKKKNTEEKNPHNFFFSYYWEDQDEEKKKKNTKKEAKLMVLNANFHDDARIIQMPPYISLGFC